MEEIRRMCPLLGTFVEVGARGTHAASAVEGALRVIEAAHGLWSIHDRDSELSRLNAAPTGEAVRLSTSTLRLLRAAKAMMRLSGGAFDFTVGGLLAKHGRAPLPDPQHRLPRGRASDLELGQGWARLARPLHLTLDGIAKGYAVDCAMGAMRRAGIVGAWINAGGDMRVHGEATLPVHRRELDGGLTPLGMLRNAAMASSAVRVGASADDARWPGLIFGPEGRLPEVGVWTVMARSAWRADALTKVAANTSRALRAEVVARLGGHLIETSETGPRMQQGTRQRMKAYAS